MLGLNLSTEKQVFFYIANNGRSDRTKDGGIFKGYYIDYDSYKCVYSGNSDKIYPSINTPKAGCYLRLEFDKTKINNSNYSSIKIGNDYFGLLPMLYFCENEFAAISDSLFILTELRSILGLKNSIHEEAALAHAWIHGMASQQLGPQTYIKNIFYAPPGTQIHVSFINDVPNLKSITIPASQFFYSQISDYKEEILKATRNAAGLISSIVNYNDSQVSISLSGGIDSRACFAAARAANVHKKCYIKTNPYAIEDFEIAQKIADSCNFDFSTPHLKIINNQNAVATWFLSSAGIYDPIFSSTSQNYYRYFEVCGYGAETFKGYYQWRTLSQIHPFKVGSARAIRPAIKRYFEFIQSQPQTKSSLEQDERFHNYFSWLPSRYAHRLQKFADAICPPQKERKDVADAVYSQAKIGLTTASISSEDPAASEWHYLLFTNPIHSGRFSVRYLLHLTPLMQPSLVALSRSSLNQYPRPEPGKPSIMTDILIALAPDLAILPFDDANKNLSQSFISERAQYLGTIDKIHNFEIIGNPDDVHCGVPSMFCELISYKGFSTPFVQKRIKELSTQAFEVIPDSIKPAFSLHKYIADNELPARISPASWECKACGKLLAFLLSD